MKVILAFSICSALTGFCNNTATVQTQYNTWSECVNGGATLITNFTDTFEEKANKERLYVTYFCNEVKNEKI